MERPTTESRPEGQEDPGGDAYLGQIHLHRHGVGAVPHVHGHRLGHLGPSGEVPERRTLAAAIGLGVDEGPQHTVVEGQYLVPFCLAPPQRHHVGHPVGVLGGQVDASRRGPRPRGRAPRRRRRTVRSDRGRRRRAGRRRER